MHPRSFLSTTTTLLLSGCAVATSLNYTQTPTGFPPCDALIQAGLGGNILLPTQSSYVSRIESYWSLNSRQHPYCIVQPRNAKEVSKVMTALLEADSGGDWNIAIRAGGHNSAGANNIDHGVTIDLLHLDEVTYDKETNLAGVGSGSKWMDVYAKLVKHDVLVTGGRDGDVGVGGFLLGGGSTFYMGTQGFGCDAVKNYEIVLTNGTIVNANEKENSDLWVALKGGGSNFGIVTRYDMEALPNTKIAHKVRAINMTHAPQIASDFVDFTENYEKYASDALVLYLTHNATTGLNETLIGTIQVNTEGNVNSKGFHKLDEIPDIKPSPYDHLTLADAAAGSQVQGGTWMAEATLTFSNNKQIMRKALDMHEQYVRELKRAIGEENFVTMFFFQPMPTLFADISKKRGGNIIGFDLEEKDAVLWTAGIEIKTNQQDRIFAQALMNKMAANLKNYSKSVGGSTNLVYMNYADTTQDPLGSYGTKNVRYLKEVAERYDPEGLFQTRFPLGFKISRVEG